MTTHSGFVITGLNLPAATKHRAHFGDHLVAPPPSPTDRRPGTPGSGKQFLSNKLELEGESAVEEIESRYFRDRRRTLPEIEAAVLALRVHGDADSVVSRSQVIAAYHRLIDLREPLVSYIADHLARWNDWESKDRLIAIAAKRGNDLPGIRRAVDDYLKRHKETITGSASRN